MGSEERFLPTPAEIADECAAIRAGWSEAERYRRLRRSPADRTLRPRLARPRSMRWFTSLIGVN
jgi:hypothetical protein